MFLHLFGTQLRIVLSASCLSYKATKLGGRPDKTTKTEALYESRCGTIKILPCSNAIITVHMFFPVHHCNTIPFLFDMQMLKFNLLEPVSTQMSEIN